MKLSFSLVQIVYLFLHEWKLKNFKWHYFDESCKVTYLQIYFFVQNFMVTSLKEYFSNNLASLIKTCWKYSYRLFKKSLKLSSAVINVYGRLLVEKLIIDFWMGIVEEVLNLIERIIQDQQKASSAKHTQAKERPIKIQCKFEFHQPAPFMIEWLQQLFDVVQWQSDF